MQLFVRCGGAGTVNLSVPARGTFADVRDALLRKRPHLTACTDLCFSFGGRACSESLPLSEADVQSESTVQVQRRLRGGGGDGGATGAESRSSYLEMYMDKKPDKVDPNEERIAKWSRCQLSGEPLAQPVVTDELGHLFNKDAVVSALVAKSIPKPLGHISSLKHLIDLKLERNPNFKAAADGSAATASGEAKFVCPITGQDFNGRTRFVVLRGSGHVIGERAIKEVPAAVVEHVGSKWDAADVLPINGTEEEVDALREKLLAKRAAEKAAKKAKKLQKADDKAAATISLIVEARSGLNGATGLPAQAAALLSAASSGELKKAVQKWPKRDAQAQPASSETAQRKKFKAGEHAPSGADEKVWKSIFISSSKGMQPKETYAARSVGARYTL